MSQADISLVQSLYAAFGRGDIQPIIDALAPDVHWHVNGRNKDFPTIGTWKGPAAVQNFFRLVVEHEEFSDFSHQEFHAVDGKVFVLGHYAGKIKKTGRAYDSDWIHVFTIRGGKVVAYKEFTDTAQFAEGYRG